MRPEVLILAPIYAHAIAALEREYTVHKMWEIPHGSNPPKSVRALVTSGLVGFDGEIFDRLPNVEIVACFGVGHGTLDMAGAAIHNIVVTNTPDASADSVADVGIGLILAVMRRLCAADRFVRAGRWPKEGFPLATGLQGKTCGIIGLGKIGRAVALRAAACGMSVCYFGRSAKADVDYRHFSNLVEMADAAHCIVVACAARPETHHLVNSAVLSALGPQGFLVNIARGSIVDQAALIAALQNGSIAGAGLDVFDGEPEVPVELRAMEQVVLLPHIGTSTVDIREARTRMLLDNLRLHFAGRPVLTPIADADDSRARNVAASES